MVRLKAFAAINSSSLGAHGRGAETAEALEMRILGAFESALNHARLGNLDQAEVCGMDLNLHIMRMGFH